MGISGEEISQTLKNLNLDQDEMGKLTKAFGDKEFMKLFADYANEVSDPKNRAENEAYLRQLEDEGRAEEFYGKGSQLIVPEPGFVIKTCDAASKEKFFVNVCTNAKIGPATCARAQGGENWSIPFSLGAVHPEIDKGNKPCSAADFCVFDETLKNALERPRFMDLLVDTALEECEKRFKVKLERSVKFPKAKYVGAGTDGKPRCLKGDAPASGKAKGSSSAAAASSSSSAGAPGQDVSDAARSKFAFPAPPGGKPAARPEPKAAKEKEKSKGPFEYEIVHQTRLDVSNTWKDQRATKDGTQPDKLVVRVKMPEVAAVSEITLDTSKTTLLVAAHGKELLIPLPREVDEEKSGAKWDKAKRILEVSLCVLAKAAPPPPPPPAPTAAAAQEEEAAPEAEAATRGCAEARGADADPGAREAEAEAAPAESRDGAGEAQGPSEPELTENEARWRAIHAGAHPAGDASGADAAGEEPAAGAPRKAEAGAQGGATGGTGGEEEDSGDESGEQEASAGAAAAPVRAAPEAPVVSAVLLKPRLRSVESVCDELD